MAATVVLPSRFCVGFVLVFVGLCFAVLCEMRCHGSSSFGPSFLSRFLDDAHHRVAVQKTPADDAQLKAKEKRRSTVKSKDVGNYYVSMTCQMTLNHHLPPVNRAFLWRKSTQLVIPIFFVSI